MSGLLKIPKPGKKKTWLSAAQGPIALAPRAFLFPVLGFCVVKSKWEEKRPTAFWVALFPLGLVV